MPSTPATPAQPESPHQLYTRRLEFLRATQAAQQLRHRRLGYAKLIAGALIVALALAVLHYPRALTLLPVPIAAFLALAIPHERLLRNLRYRARAIAFYQRGLARLQGLWASPAHSGSQSADPSSTGAETGERFLDPDHPYARDLDLFGPASLFQLLSAARTRSGEETLARWLLAPASPEEVRARQAAVAELSSQVEFRERLFSIGETVRLGLHPDALAAWAERPPLPRWRALRLLFAALALLWIVSIASWIALGWGMFALAATVVNLTCARFLLGRFEEPAAAIEQSAQDLNLLAEVLRLIEAASFHTPRLLALQTALRRDGLPPSTAVRRLGRIAGWLESRRNPYARVLDLVVFWSPQALFRAELWRHHFGPAIRAWIATVGEFEALASLSGFAFEHPEDVFPEFIDSSPGAYTAGSSPSAAPGPEAPDPAGPQVADSQVAAATLPGSCPPAPLFDAEGLAHPLLPAETAVRNDIRLDAQLQLILLSGPNMAGKSTFIRSIGINAVLAQCGAPVRARRLTLSTLAVAASICVLDSLSGGISRFYAEIRRVKLISDLTRQPTPVLFLLDELLSGTNSHDRFAGTRYVVESLLRQGAIGIVSTHDLALTQIPASLGARAVNCHFEDRYENGELHFDYILKPGIVQTSNALRLMRSIGLGVTED